MMGYDMTNTYSQYSYSHSEREGDNEGRTMEEEMNGKKISEWSDSSLLLWPPIKKTLNVHRSIFCLLIVLTFTGPSKDLMTKQLTRN